MTTKQHPAEIASAAAVATATGFIASLFLGVGKFEKREAATIEEARKAAEALRLAYPLSTRRPLIYASLPDGRQELVVEKTLADTPISERIAAAQADETPAPIVPAAQQPKEAAMPTKTYSDRSNCRKAAIKAGIAPQNIEIIKTGHRFSFRRKAEPAKAVVETKPAQPKPAAPVKARANPAPKKAAEAKPPVGKRSAALEAAKAGKMPTPPDFSAETHTRFRAKLAEIVKLAKAGDVKGLKAVAINPISSSPKAMDRYRNLAVIALEAKARG